MIFTVVWVPDAVNSLRRLRAEDAAGVRTLSAACRRLAADPFPAEGRSLGGGTFRRLHIGDYRVLYKLDEGAGVLWISHVGRVPPKE